MDVPATAHLPLQPVARCELTNAHINKHTNKHHGSQYLLPEIISTHNKVVSWTVDVHAHQLEVASVTSTTFAAVVDPGTRISFLFARCRYLSIFGILLLIN